MVGEDALFSLASWSYFLDFSYSSLGYPYAMALRPGTLPPSR